MEGGVGFELSWLAGENGRRYSCDWWESWLLCAGACYCIYLLLYLNLASYMVIGVIKLVTLGRRRQRNDFVEMSPPVCRSSRHLNRSTTRYCFNATSSAMPDLDDDISEKQTQEHATLQDDILMSTCWVVFLYPAAPDLPSG